MQDWCGIESIISIETIYSKDNDPEHKVSNEWQYYLSRHYYANEKLPGYIKNKYSYIIKFNID